MDDVLDAVVHLIKTIIISSAELLVLVAVWCGIAGYNNFIRPV